MLTLNHIIKTGRNAGLRLYYSRSGIFFLFFAAGFIIYANSFSVPFFWDDNDNVINNIYITSWRYLPKYFSENLIAGSGLLNNYWRPLLLVSYSLDYHFFGFNKYWWHFVNISLHIAVAYFLFLILDILFHKRFLAFLASFIFLIHPVQIEAVTWITGRADGLSSLFLLLTVFFYLKFRQTTYLKISYYVYSLFGFIAALLSKETAVVMPAILILLETVLEKSEISNQNKIKLRKFLTRFIFILPFIFLDVLYFIGRITILNFNNTLNFYNDDSLFATDIWTRFLTFLKVFWSYLGLLIFPRNLNTERLVEPISSLKDNLWLFIPAAIIIGAFVFSIFSFKKEKIYLFGFFWFFIILAPTSNILIPINGIMYEHWLYLPLVGFFIFLFVLLGDLYRFFRFFRDAISENFKKIVRIGGILILVVYLMFLGITTIKRNFIWQDPVLFYEDILRYNQKNLKVWNNLGMEYANVGNLDKAIESYKKAVELDAKNQSAPPHHNLANAYRDKGRVQEAEEEYKKAIAIDENFYFSYNNLAALYLKNKEYDKAAELLKKELRVFPQNQNIINTLNILQNYDNKKP